MTSWVYSHEKKRNMMTCDANPSYICAYMWRVGDWVACSHRVVGAGRRPSRAVAGLNQPRYMIGFTRGCRQGGPAAGVIGWGPARPCSPLSYRRIDLGGWLTLTRTHMIGLTLTLLEMMEAVLNF